MFYVGECVRSSHHGLGVVVSSGENPRVRFINGGEFPVDGHTLQAVPDEVHDAEARKL